MARVLSLSECYGSYPCHQVVKFAVIPNDVRGDTRRRWAYVLRASLKTQSSSDFRNFEGFISLAQRQLGRWIYSMALVPIKERIVGCTEKFYGYLPGLLLNMLENG